MQVWHPCKPSADGSCELTRQYNTLTHITLPTSVTHRYGNVTEASLRGVSDAYTSIHAGKPGGSMSMLTPCEKDQASGAVQTTYSTPAPKGPELWPKSVPQQAAAAEAKAKPVGMPASILTQATKTLGATEKKLVDECSPSTPELEAEVQLQEDDLKAQVTRCSVQYAQAREDAGNPLPQSALTALHLERRENTIKALQQSTRRLGLDQLPVEDDVSIDVMRALPRSNNAGPESEKHLRANIAASELARKGHFKAIKGRVSDKAAAKRARLNAAGDPLELFVVLGVREQEIYEKRQPTTRKNEMSYFGLWASFCIMLSRLPYRLALAGCPSAETILAEDQLLKAFVIYCSLHYISHQALKNCISAVRTVHRRLVRIIFPAMPYASQMIKEVRSVMWDEAGARRDRHPFMPHHFRAIAQYWSDSAIAMVSQNTAASMRQAKLLVNALVLLAICRAKAFRPGELCPKEGWSAETHWARAALAPLLTCFHGCYVMIKPPLACKTLYSMNAVRREMHLRSWPIMCFAGDPSCVPEALRLQEAIDPLTPQLAASSPVSRDPATNEPFSLQLFDTMVKFAHKMCFPNEPDLTVSTYSMKIGAVQAFQFAGAPKEMRAWFANWSQGPDRLSMDGVYSGEEISSILEVLTRMYTTDFNPRANAVVNVVTELPPNLAEMVDSSEITAKRPAAATTSPHAKKRGKSSKQVKTAAQANTLVSMWSTSGSTQSSAPNPPAPPLPAAVAEVQLSPATTSPARPSPTISAAGLSSTFSLAGVHRERERRSASTSPVSFGHLSTLVQQGRETAEAAHQASDSVADGDTYVEDSEDQVSGTDDVDEESGSVRSGSPRTSPGFTAESPISGAESSTFASVLDIEAAGEGEGHREARQDEEGALSPNHHDLENGYEFVDAQSDSSVEFGPMAARGLVEEVVEEYEHVDSDRSAESDHPSSPSSEGSGYSSGHSSRSSGLPHAARRIGHFRDAEGNTRVCERYDCEEPLKKGAFVGPRVPIASGLARDSMFCSRQCLQADQVANSPSYQPPPMGSPSPRVRLDRAAARDQLASKLQVHHGGGLAAAATGPSGLSQQSQSPAPPQQSGAARALFPTAQTEETTEAAAAAAGYVSPRMSDDEAFDAFYKKRTSPPKQDGGRGSRRSRRRDKERKRRD